MHVQQLPEEPSHTNVIYTAAADFNFHDSWDMFWCYQADDCSAYTEAVICLILEAVHATFWCCHNFFWPRFD